MKQPFLQQHARMIKNYSFRATSRHSKQHLLILSILLWVRRQSFPGPLTGLLGLDEDVLCQILHRGVAHLLKVEDVPEEPLHQILQTTDPHQIIVMSLDCAHAASSLRA